MNESLGDMQIVANLRSNLLHFELCDVMEYTNETQTTDIRKFSWI